MMDLIGPWLMMICFWSIVYVCFWIWSKIDKNVEF